MNTFVAIQGVDTAFVITLSPVTVDFPTAPDMVAEVHRGDGRAALATLTPTWTDTAADLITVPMPGPTSATLPPGNYILSARLVDNSAYLSWDTLSIYPGPASATPIRSLIPPSECLGIIPELKGDRTQIDALTGLLEAATVACENYCDRKFILADYDATWPINPGDWSPHYIDLEYPVAAITSVSIGPAGWPTATAEFSDTARWDLYAKAGQLRVDSSYWSGTQFTTSGPRGRLVRVVYRAGYAIDPADVIPGVEPVPGDLRSACLMVAIAIRESAKTAGPTIQQGQQGQYYTKSVTETSIPAPARVLLDRYSRKWVVA